MVHNPHIFSFVDAIVIGMHYAYDKYMQRQTKHICFLYTHHTHSLEIKIIPWWCCWLCGGNFTLNPRYCCLLFAVFISNLYSFSPILPPWAKRTNTKINRHEFLTIFPPTDLNQPNKSLKSVSDVTSLVRCILHMI